MKENREKCPECDRSFHSDSSQKSVDLADLLPKKKPLQKQSSKEQANKEVKKTRKERRLEAIADYQEQVANNHNVYSEIKVPVEFMSKFELEKNLD